MGISGRIAHTFQASPMTPLLALVLLLLGLFAVMVTPREEEPQIDVTMANVVVPFPGASSKDVENLVATPGEQVLSRMTGVDHVFSVSRPGMAVITVQFEVGVKNQDALVRLYDTVHSNRDWLPANLGVGEPIVKPKGIDDVPIVSLTFWTRDSRRSAFELQQIARSAEVEFKHLAGTRDVTTLGGPDHVIRVAMDAERMNAYGVTAQDLRDALQIANNEQPSGRLVEGGREMLVHTGTLIESAQDVKNLVVAVRSEGSIRKPVFLADVATVEDGPDQPKRYVWFGAGPAAAQRGIATGGEDASPDGTYPAVTLAISKKPGVNAADVADAVIARAESLKGSLIPEGVEVTVTRNYGATATEKAQKLIGKLVFATAFVVLLVFFALGRREALIVGIAVSLTLAATLFASWAWGFTLNRVSLFALIFSIGILVDDAIVEIENIVRHMRMGKSPYRAAIEAADEIGLAVVATTLTIAAVFAPVSFMGGIAGQYFKQFGLTVAIAVLFSLAVARLITPLVAAYFMKDTGHREGRDGAVMRGYVRLLGWSVRHRFATIGMGIAIFAGSIWLSTLLPSGFLPTNDISRALLSVELPPGSTLAETQKVSDEIARAALSLPEVKSVYATAGSGGSGGLALSSGEVRKAQIVINLKPRSARKIDQKTFETQFSKTLATMPDLRVSWSQNGQNTQRGFEVILSGSDGAAVAEAAVAVEKAVRADVPELANVVSSAALDRPEIRIVPKLDEAAELGVSVDTIAETVRIATIGDISANLAKFSAKDRQIDIRVQLAENARTRLSTFDALKVPTASGGAVPLSAVADVQFGKGPTALDRYDRARRVAVEADLVGDTPLGDALAKVKALPAAQNLPAGVTLKEAGDAEIMAEVFSGFAMAMAAGLMLVLAVLVLLFHDILQPITILVSLPLSVGGAFIALLITGNSVSMPVVIGFLMLMGIVTKNAILLVDFAIESMHQGVDRFTSLIEAGRKRAQPIVMTTIAMVAGMLPSALALGEGGAFRAPMAIAVIGGLITSTVLSLVFVPAVFTVMDDLSHFLGRIFGRFIGGKDEPDGRDLPPALHHPAGE